MAPPRNVITAEVHLTGTTYDEHSRFGTININPDTSVNDLGEEIKYCILEAQQNNHEFADVLEQEVEWRKASLEALGDNRPPLIGFSPTIIAPLRVRIKAPYWERLNSMKDFCGTDTQPAPKLRINIAFTADSEGSNDGPADGTNFVVCTLHRSTDEYIRVGHIQHNDAKWFGGTSRVLGIIKARHCILAKVSYVNARRTADELYWNTAWEMNGLADTIGDPSVGTRILYADLHQSGKGLFTDFKGPMGTGGKWRSLPDETALGGMVNRVHHKHLRLARQAHSAGLQPLRQQYHAPVLPRMTLSAFKPSSIGNRRDTKIPKRTDCHAVVHVIYHTADRYTEEETSRYPETTQFPLTKVATVQGLEDKLFANFKSDADRSRQDVDKYRTSAGTAGWRCEWFILPRTAGSQVLHKVHDMHATVASFVDRNGIADKVFVYTECHIMRADGDHGRDD